MSSDTDKKVTFDQLAELYCESQEQTPEGLAEVLRRQIENFDSEGFMLLRCEVLDSSRLGDRVILGFGGSHTYQNIPDHPITPRGLASDTSVVECWCDAKEVPTCDG